MYKILHFWPVNGGMGLRFKWIVSELNGRGIGEHIHSLTDVFKSVVKEISWWRDGKGTVIIFTSLVCPLIVFLKLFFPRLKVVYFVRGDEVLEASSRNRKLRLWIAYFFQFLLWRLVKAKHAFVSWDLEYLFRKRYGPTGVGCVVPNTVGRQLPPTRVFNGTVAVVGDFGTVKDIEWALNELSGSEFLVHLYGNSISLPSCYGKNIISFGVMGDLTESLKKSSLLIITSKSEGYPNIVNEALESGCAVAVHDGFPFEFFPLNKKWKFSKKSGELLSFLRAIYISREWHYDEDNAALRAIVEKDWMELLSAEAL